MAMMKKWNGSAWVNMYPKMWNGSSWVECDVKRWDGGSWVSNRQTYTTTWSCTWSQTYTGDGTKRTDVGSTMYQGYYSSTNGIHRSLVGFDYASIQSTLTDAIIDKVEIYMDNNHAYSSAGIDMVYGYHSNASAPTTFAPPGGSYSQNFAKYEGKWFTCPDNQLGNGLKNGSYKGIYLFANSTSNSYYGYWAGNGETGEPQIRITYRK